MVLLGSMVSAWLGCGPPVVEVVRGSSTCDDAFTHAKDALERGRASLETGRPGEALVRCVSAPRRLANACERERDPAVADLERALEALCDHDAPVAAAGTAAADAEAEGAGSRFPIGACLRLEHALGILVAHHHEMEAEVRPLVERWHAACDRHPRSSGSELPTGR